ncbi:MAG: coproporphyrinogen III oxidase family protein [Coriobacteriia bacterium]|nr:coproporphyrinogen III oxidase family protein [Coriobacteriia bacterium]
MLAERLLTPVVRTLNGRYLALEHADLPKLPGPIEGRKYLLYVHVPFCQQLCPYCSFNRFPFSEKRAVPYFERLREEMRMVKDLGYDFDSMYVGGGTPTIMLDELCDTIDLARELFSIKEVSSETNPNHLIPAYVEALAPRVQRLSVGVQSFDDGLLKQMDRYDKYGSSAEIVERIKATAGAFHSMNVDMIFNFPSQTEAMLRRDIEILKDCGCNQTTFYPLMASPAVDRKLGETVGRVDYSREARFYEILSEGLSDTFENGSAWTFSRIAGGMIDEYIVDYEEYVGIGSGAFSYLDGTLYVNTFSLREYDERLGSGRMGVAGKRSFGAHERMRYRLLMELFGLMLDKQKFLHDFGVPIERGLPMEMGYMRTVGAFDRDDHEVLTLTPRGRYLMVAMMREFFIGVNNVRDQARAALKDDERALLFGDGEACAADAGGVPPAPGA